MPGRLVVAGVEDAQWVVVAGLGAPHGLRGEVRLFPETDFPERLEVGREVAIWTRSGAPRPSRLRAVRVAGRQWLARLQGIDSRASAIEVAGGTLRVPARSLPPLAPGQFYHHELVGRTVLRPDGRPLGRLSRVERTGANDVYVVERPDGGPVFVPAIRSAVEEIVPGDGVVRLRDLPGLLDDEEGGGCGSTS